MAVMPVPSKLGRRRVRHLPRVVKPADRNPYDSLDPEMRALLRQLDEIPYETAP
jgi:hypothetical protein